jgi:tetratricopeptide (TPR) repeat protein
MCKSLCISLLVVCLLLGSLFALGQNSTNHYQLRALFDQLEEFQENNYDSLLYTADKFLKQNKSKLSTEDITSIIFYRATAYFHKGDYKKAQKIWTEALINFKLLNDLNGTASCLNCLGSVEEIKGRYETSIRYYQNALKIYEKTNNTERIANAFNNIGNLYIKLGDLDKSFDYFQKSILKCEEAHNTDDINIQRDKANALNNIASIYAAKSDFHKAILHFKEAETVFLRTGNNISLISVWLNIGSMYLELNKIDSAMMRFKEGMALSKSLKNKNLYANSLYFNSLAYTETGESKKAEKSLNEALILAEELQADDLAADIHYQLYELYTKKRRFEKALDHYKKYSVINDSILSLEKQKQMQELLTKYESEKKDEEIKSSKLN